MSKHPPGEQHHIALIGNPNSGKSTLFNALTGMKQKVGNFPGVTIDKKSGPLHTPGGRKLVLTDFPGAYSLHPLSLEEKIVTRIFTQPDDPTYPDAIIYVANVNALDKQLLLYTQLCDLGLPVMLVLNMMDIAQQRDLKIDLHALSEKLDTPVVGINARNVQETNKVKRALDHLLNEPKRETEAFYSLSEKERSVSEEVARITGSKNPYQSLLIAHHHDWLPQIKAEERSHIRNILEQHEFKPVEWQIKETMSRYDRFTPILKQVLSKEKDQVVFTDYLDKVLTHRIAGPVIFLAILLLIFQAIFAWATYPMDWIEGMFTFASQGARNFLPSGWISDLMSQGIIPGLAGVLVFIPQIAILFFFLSLMEEVGYMSRVVYMFDHWMQKFGLNGKSLVALFSGGACAIPAIMSARTIPNEKERLITILVTPFISCSARLPVYTVLVGFIVPASLSVGWFNAQGLVFLGLYLIGIVTALIVAWLLSKWLPSKEPSQLLLEMPEYKPPHWKSVWITVSSKVWSFIREAGKIILMISIVLWGLASYGPGDDMARAEQQAIERAETDQLSKEETGQLVASYKIEQSYAGHLGRFIEPAIKPLGYDWKIGIALITSFAAREVFVGTMATIYSVGSENELSIRDQMAEQKHPATGQKVYTLATSLSLILFYVFALQCMSTVAVVRKETGSWFWPSVQFLGMTGLAYVAALFTYQFLA